MNKTKVQIKEICRDLAAEYNALDAIISELTEQQWEKVTPFYEWTIQDEITHIAYFDERAGLSADNPDAFVHHFNELMQNFKLWNEKTLTPDLDLSIADLLAWWRKERENLLVMLKEKRPKDRLPWYGPTMGAISMAAARIMEVWAHGHDVCDALNIQRPATDRLRHIAHIGIITFGWSFSNRKLAVPETPVRVELKSPGNDIWTWGPKDAEQIVKGSAEGFCQVVTQRRNVADTDIKTTGNIAAKWMQIAQAFAGPPENGPAPGQTTK